MTIEEKAKAYDEVLERVKPLYEWAKKDDSPMWSTYEYLFPQLVESQSKDERIRKALIDGVRQIRCKNGITQEQMLAYLEKQKDANKAIEAVDRIDKYIDEHVANAHDMKDSNPDKKYYSGWDDALGKMAGILQDVYSGEKKKESLRDFIDDFPYSDEQKEPHFTKRNALFDKCVAKCDPKTMEEVNKRVDDIINMSELSAFEQALTNFIGDWEDDEERWPSKFVKKHGKHILDMAREELQKEQKHPDGCFTCDEYKKGYEEGRRNGFTAGYNKAMKEIEQKEQKPVDYEAELKKCKDNPLYFYDKYVSIKQKPVVTHGETYRVDTLGTQQVIAGKMPQKPAEWSEEDEGELQNAIDALEFLGKKGVYKSESGYDAALQAASWLKLFRLQPKSEWNEDFEEEDLRTRFAFYTYKDEDDVLYLSNIFVEETSRNKGFGTKILAAAEKVAEILDATSIRLKVKQDNPANVWYWKHGYNYMTSEDGYDWLEKNLKYLKPKKSIKWSGDDELMIESLIAYLKGTGQDFISNDMVYWLKSLPERFNLQPKQEWSEEEKDKLNSIERLIVNANANGNYLIEDKEAIDLQHFIRSIVKPTTNLAEWSENDKLHYVSVLNALEYVKGCKSDYDKIEAVISDIAWLRELPERFNLPPKQEWSEEDEEKLKAICTYLRDYSRLAKLDDKLRFNEYCDFLESLRPSWKPSEEQMNALKDVIETVPMTCRQQVPLESLYSDLNKNL